MRSQACPGDPKRVIESGPRCAVAPSAPVSPVAKMTAPSKRTSAPDASAHSTRLCKPVGEVVHRCGKIFQQPADLSAQAPPKQRLQMSVGRRVSCAVDGLLIRLAVGELALRAPFGAEVLAKIVPKAHNRWSYAKQAGRISLFFVDRSQRIMRLLLLQKHEELFGGAPRWDAETSTGTPNAPHLQEEDAIVGASPRQSTTS